MAEGIRRLRAGQVERSPGFDGEYGKITLLSPDEMDMLAGQTSLFGKEEKVPEKDPVPDFGFTKGKENSTDCREG